MVEICMAVLFVLVVTYAVAVAIKRTADRAALRSTLDALVHDTCPHPVFQCRVT
jgi:hypothetical protein